MKDNPYDAAETLLDSENQCSTKMDSDHESWTVCSENESLGQVRDLETWGKRLTENVSLPQVTRATHGRLTAPHRNDLGRIFANGKLNTVMEAGRAVCARPDEVPLECLWYESSES